MVTQSRICDKRRKQGWCGGHHWKDCFDSEYRQRFYKVIPCTIPSSKCSRILWQARIYGGYVCNEIAADFFKSTQDMEKVHAINLDRTNMERHSKRAFGISGQSWWEGNFLMGSLSPAWEVGASSQILKGDQRKTWDNRLAPHFRFARLEEEAFRQNFLSDCQKWEWISNVFVRCISHIEVPRSLCKADGDYPVYCLERYRQLPGEEQTDMWGGQEVTFRIQLWYPEGEDKFEGWTIVRRYCPAILDGVPNEHEIAVKKKCWIVPHSTNLRYPPLKGWIPCDPLARGNPQIKYIFRWVRSDTGFAQNTW